MTADPHVPGDLMRALEALDAGEPVEVLVARYPELTSELFAAARLSSTSTWPAAPEAEREASRRAFIEEAARPAEAEGTPAERDDRETAPSGRAAPHGVRIAAIAFGLVAVLALGFTPFLRDISRDSLPGDLAYPVKRALEDVAFFVVPGEPYREALLHTRGEIRRSEVSALIAMDRDADVDFSGIVEAFGDDGWRISGIPVTEAPDAIIRGNPALEEEVHVYGRIEDGRVFAEEIVYYTHDHEAETATPGADASGSP